METGYVLEVDGLSKSFGRKKIIDDVSFKVNAGDVFGFLGPNGAGKTTIIRIILQLVHADSGSVVINGYDLKKDFVQAIRSVGAIVETPSFYTDLTGYQNLVQIANLHPGIPKSRIDEVLAIAGLTGRARDKVITYSLGMKQRLGIARALLNYPRLVFLDEPTNGLDPQGIIEVREMISQLALEQDITFFITSHLMHEVEQVCNKVAILDQGKIITQGMVKELLKSDREIVQFHTREQDQAASLLGQLDYVKSHRPLAIGLEVELAKGYSGKLNHLFSSHNIVVDYIIPKEQNLEELFIQLTKGGKSHVKSS